MLRWLFKRSERTEVVVVVNGTERPTWALRAGHKVTASEYDHGERRLVMWVHDEGNYTAQDPIEQWTNV